MYMYLSRTLIPFKCSVVYSVYVYVYMRMPNVTSAWHHQEATFNSTCVTPVSPNPRATCRLGAVGFAVLRESHGSVNGQAVTIRSIRYPAASDAIPHTAMRILEINELAVPLPS